MSKRILETIVLLLGITFFVWLAYQAWQSHNDRPDLSVVHRTTRMAPPLAKAYGLAWGVGNAPIHIVEYVNYNNLLSIEQANTYDPEIVDALALSGKVYYELRFLVGENDETTQRAIHAVFCATEQNRGWEMHYTITANWHPNPYYYKEIYSEERLIRMAGTIDGLDVDRFKNCLTSNSHKHVLQANRYASVEKVKKTPLFTFLVINGQRFRAPIGLSKMKEIFREVAPEVQFSNFLPCSSNDDEYFRMRHGAIIAQIM